MNDRAKGLGDDVTGKNTEAKRFSRLWKDENQEDKVKCIPHCSMSNSMKYRSKN